LTHFPLLSKTLNSKRRKKLKIKSIDFPNELIRAIRNEKTVVFAGAGVSMGSPANLPSFKKLAIDISTATNEEKKENETEDRFFGRLHQKGFPVHSLVAKFLHCDSGSATSLHHSFLRMFKNASKVKVVTTNFDTLFEYASITIFEEPIEVFKAPALPLGRDFKGIIHVHGCRDAENGMVLTDADFGRAYLIEGWARRFLLDLFRNYTVLFVGYSHDDVVMHYLSRALPTSNSARRFALVENNTTLYKWHSLGIIPITFTKQSNDDYSSLTEGVNALANYVSQNLLDRKSGVVAIASGMPPSDDEGIDQIIDALNDESTTRFFTQAALEPAWIDWLDSRKLLDPLFKEEKLTAVQELLAKWLADRFAIEHYKELIALITRHHTNIGSSLWMLIGNEISLSKDGKIDNQALLKWISVLIGTMPKRVNEHILYWLAERCGEQKELNGLLLVFSVMLSHGFEIKKGFGWLGKTPQDTDKIKYDIELPSPSDHWSLNEIYTRYIKPSLNEFAPQLLLISIRELEKRHLTYLAWDRSSRDYDSSSFRRSAIEPHEQDKLREPIDVLIDAARDCLVSIGESEAIQSDGWLDILSKSNMPIIRRLFTHGLDEQQGKSADEKLRFFLDRQDLHDINAHHEIYRFVANLYPALSEPQKSELIARIVAYEWPNRDDEDFAERTAYEHFRWLQCLLDADPKCKLASSAREKIINKYPKFKPSSHPDFTHWMESGRWVKSTSPYTVEELDNKTATEWVETLLAFKGNEFHGPNESGLRMNVTEKAKKNISWGLDLADELAKKCEWKTYLWGGLLQAWEEWSPDNDQCLSILTWLNTKDLWEHHLLQIIRVLHTLVRDGGKDYASMILSEANQVAMALWPVVENENDLPDTSDNWLQLAINRPSGVLAEYWLGSIELWRKGQDPKPDTMDDKYRIALNQIILSGNMSSGLSLTIFASQLAFFLYVDYEWTKAHLLVWFDDKNDSRRYQQSWDGFLSWGRLNPQVVEELSPYFEKAFLRLDYELAPHRDRFIEYFAALICFYVSDPLYKWIPIFFKNAKSNDRKKFARQIDLLLRGMNYDQQEDIWKRWIKKYWENRMQGLPQPLLPEEVSEMVEWAPRFKKLFEETIELEIQMPPAQFQHSSVIYDLRKSDLVDQYPEATAKLLVYLLHCECPMYIWHGLNDIMKRLDKQKISKPLWDKLEELLLAKGIS
jgi:hypothetical protein